MTRTRDIAGNSFRNALNLGTLRNKTRSITDTVGRSDSNDYFRFKLKSTSALTVSLTGLSADADLEIYYENTNNPAVFTGSEPGTANEVAADPDAPKGVYYVRVFPGAFRRAVDYTLTIHAIELPSRDRSAKARAARRDTFKPMSGTSTLRSRSGSLWH